MNTLLFILITYGFSNIVVYGSIFDGFREFWKKLNPSFFGTLFSCMVCLTFFSPTLYYGLGDLNIFGLFEISKEVSSVFWDGVLASGTTWLLHTGQEMMERAFQEE